jgi:hypothetical protein
MPLILILLGMVGLAVVFPPIIFLYLIGLGVVISEFRR